MTKRLVLGAALILSLSVLMFHRVDAQGITKKASAICGSNTQVQFNDSGVCGADSGLIFNKTTDLLTIGSATGAVDSNVFGIATLHAANAFSIDGNIGLMRNGAAGAITKLWEYTSQFKEIARSDSLLGWASSTADTDASTFRGNLDTALARNAAGVVEINSGTVGTIRDVKLRMLRVGQTTPPTCSASCGTSPSVLGSDTAMTVTMGATGVPASPFTVTFNTTWAAAPSCTVQSALGTMVVGKMAIAAPTTTTTVIVTTNGTAPAAADKYFIHCIGVQ